MSIKAAPFQYRVLIVSPTHTPSNCVRLMTRPRQDNRDHGVTLFQGEHKGVLGGKAGISLPPHLQDILPRLLSPPPDIRQVRGEPSSLTRSPDRDCCPR